MRKARLAAAMVLTAPFVPMIFQGEEFATSSQFLYFADHEDRELARAVSEGRRREHAPDGAWDSLPDPELQTTFDLSKLNWKELEEPAHAEMMGWYRSLIVLRLSNPSLIDGDLDSVEVQIEEDQGCLSMKRGSIQCLYNFSENAVRVAVLAHGQLLLASDPAISYERDEVSLPGLSFVALGLAAL
jgi:maltooligosyltrehalose trehalohydrolase